MSTCAIHLTGLQCPRVEPSGNICSQLLTFIILMGTSSPGYMQSFKVIGLQAGFHCAVCHLQWIFQPYSHHSLTSRLVRKKDLGWAPGHHKEKNFSSPSHSMWHFKSTAVSWACRMSSPRMIVCDLCNKHPNSQHTPSWSQLHQGLLHDREGLLDTICRTYDKHSFLLGSPAVTSGPAVVIAAPVWIVMCQAISD